MGIYIGISNHIGNRLRSLVKHFLHYITKDGQHYITKDGFYYKCRE